MGKADGLSRRADWKVGTDKDNENQVLIKDNWIRNMYEVVIEGPEVDIVEKIKKARSKDEDVVRVVEEMKKAGVKELRENEWKVEGDLVLKKGKIYVPKDEELRAEVVQLHHDVPTAGHECYDPKLKGLSNELTLVLSDTRELDRVPSTK